jgi:hypothetical protein
MADKFIQRNEDGTWSGWRRGPVLGMTDATRVDDFPDKESALAWLRIGTGGWF